MAKVSENDNNGTGKTAALPQGEVNAPIPYEPNPRYQPAGSRVGQGWDGAVATLSEGGLVLAVDGPVILDWEAVVSGISQALGRRGRTARHVDLSPYLLPWPEVVRRTTTEELAEDPDFARLANVSLGALHPSLPEETATGEEVVVVTGPGAALVDADITWYADLPKRYAEAAVVAGQGRNLGQGVGDGPATTRRLFYVDWAILDQHREDILDQIDLWVDTQQSVPTFLEGSAMRKSLAELANRPFRTRPTFNTAPWGGHWGQNQLGLGRHLDNTALGYELIAPESGILLGYGTQHVEVPFQLAVAQSPRPLLGDLIHEQFGTSFPIRFDYLDTVEGGNLSVHCHPRDDYMSRVFGWPYTQHESYYIMVGGAEHQVFLGLRSEVDVETFRQAAEAADQDGTAFEIEDFVQTFPAEPHQLFMIPAGTPHGSGKGNVVLEVSATPYLYSLRFYDWLRRDAAGGRRPVHVDHAFANLDPTRRGMDVEKELVRPPEEVRAGQGWREELLGDLPEVFFEVRRMLLSSDTPAPDTTEGRFHVLNVVDGDGVEVETAAGHSHRLNYAETLVVPASVGDYKLHRLGERPVRVVKAMVK